MQVDASPLLDKKGIKRVQQIVGSILYYARAVDMTVLIALSSIAMEQTKATEMTMKRCAQLLNYLADHADAKIRFYASNMAMNIHSDASYLSEGRVERAVIFSWDGYPKMETRSELTGHSMLAPM